MTSLSWVDVVLWWALIGAAFHRARYNDAGWGDWLLCLMFWPIRVAICAREVFR
jgi:hypothetical protein